MMRFNKNRIAIICPNDGSDVRVGKVCRSLSGLGFEVHLIGWDRRPNEPKTVDLGTSIAHILPIMTSNGRLALLPLIRYYWFILLLLLRLRPQTVCCVDEEYALLALPFSRLLFRYLVCDIYDSLSDRHSNAGFPLHLILAAIQYAARRGAHVLITTDLIRQKTLGQFRGKSIVVGNYPEDPGLELSRAHPSGAIKIYVSGSLSLARGLRELLAAIEFIEGVEIVCAGWIYDDYARDIFLTHPRVTYLGVITARKSLEVAAECDAIFAYYLPTTINNIQASPNKIYDAMSVGRPIIINDEVLVSNWVVKHGIGFSSPYFNKQGLADIVTMLFHHRSQLCIFSKNAYILFSKGYSWATAETKLAKLYDNLRNDVIIDKFNIPFDMDGDKSDYAVCTSCVMDTTDADILFDDNGVCDHCITFNMVTAPNWHNGAVGVKELSTLIEKIKQEGRGKDFDCIIGMSGGIDSSYLTYLAKEQFGLRPLVFHVDGGWNSQEAVNNIEKLVDGLGLDLYTEVIDWEEMRDLQLAFFKSGVSHIDAPQDNAFFATMYKFALQHKVKYILTGANLSTEGIRNPVQWMYYQSDSRQIRDIHRQFGTRPLVNYPLTSIFWHKIYLPYIKGIKTLRPLNYVPYIKQDAMQLLIDKFGWQPYSQKHFESRFTRFYESYWLPKRFGFDVRRVQYSSLILTEQMNREEALDKLKQSPFDESTIAHDLEYVANKLGISVDELNGYIDIPKRTYRDYKSQSQIYKLGARAMKFFGLEIGGKR